MPNIEIRHIAFGSPEFKLFLHFPWEIYKKDPHWVPPLLMDQKNLFNPQKNPFFDHSTCELLGAFSDGKMVGRMVVGVNKNSNDHRNEKVAFFGFFESVDNSHVSQALFDEACKWAKEKGMQTLRGPFNLTFHDDCGLLVEGFDSDPYLMMTYNPEYYGSLIENAGIKQVMDAYAFFGTTEKFTNPKLLAIAEQVKNQLKPVIRPIDMKQNFVRDVHIAMDMVNQSLEGHWATYPLTKKEIEHKANELKQIVVPELCFFIEVQGKPVGFSLSLPNYNEAIKKANGRLFPFGLLKILYTARKIKSLMSFQLGMIKEFQETGLGPFCYAEIWKRARKLGYIDGEGGRVFANNPRMIRGAEFCGGKRYKTYRWYEKAL